MKTISEIIDYRDSSTISKVFEIVKQKRQAKKLQEAKQLFNNALTTHEELIKDDEKIVYEDHEMNKPYFFKNILFFTNNRKTN
mgnify:FL=1